MEGQSVLKQNCVNFRLQLWWFFNNDVQCCSLDLRCYCKAVKLKSSNTQSFLPLHHSRSKCVGILNKSLNKILSFFSWVGIARTECGELTVNGLNCSRTTLNVQF